MNPQTDPNQLDQNISPPVPSQNPIAPPTVPTAPTPVTPPAIDNPTPAVEPSQPVPANPNQTPGDNLGLAQAPLVMPQETPGPTNEGRSKKRILKIVLIVVGVLIAFAIGALAFIRSQKTSVEAVNNFNEAVSALNSKSSSFTLKIGFNNTSSEAELETSASELKGAVVAFEDATSKLKSDKKPLKVAAEAYATQLNLFNDSIVPLALETAKVEAIGKKMGEIAVSSTATSSEAAFLAEVTRVSGEYDKYSTELKDLKLENSDAKELRDAFVDVSDQLVAMLGEVRTAFVARDLTALSAVQTKISRLETDNPAITKEKDISGKLGQDSEVMKKVDDARKALNEEIAKSNSAAS